jgi:hypothetical protein
MMEGEVTEHKVEIPLNKHGEKYQPLSITLSWQTGPQMSKETADRLGQTLGESLAFFIRQRLEDVTNPASKARLINDYAKQSDPDRNRNIAVDELSRIFTNLPADHFIDDGEGE